MNFQARISAALDADLRARVDAYADAHDQSVSAVTRCALREWLTARSGQIDLHAVTVAPAERISA
jgi:predicted transcriptional regulator